MSATRLMGWCLLLAVTMTAATVGAASPPRPGDDGRGNFYLVLGAEILDLDLDPRGCDEFTAGGLDPTLDKGGLVLGVGWVFRHPLRLDLTASAWEADVDREGTDCVLARVAADLHLELVSSDHAALEASFSAGFLALNYEGLDREEGMPGWLVGLGVTGRLAVAGPVGLGLAYRYQLGRFTPKTFRLDADSESFRVQPTARMHGVQLTVFIDL